MEWQLSGIEVLISHLVHVLICHFLLSSHRPPGHHAMKSEYCGYCFYNNVGLAAQHALDKGTKRILIVDWDVHHGQATQQMFYEDPR